LWGTGVTPATEEMLQMWPAFRSIIPGRTSRVSHISPTTLTWTISSIRSGEVDSKS
jgi:hypothetical protein